MKTCPRCRIKKATSAFQKNRASPDGLQYHCRDCRREIDGRPEKRAADRARYRENPDRCRDSGYQRRYGITLAQYDVLLKLQRGRCAVCRRKCPSGKRLAVDHNHTTRRVRGLLCSRCNPLIGYAQDNPATLQKAIAYLEKTQ